MKRERQVQTIEPLGAEHVRPVARLHCSSLAGLLSRLGPAAAEAYYAACVRAPSATGFVLLEEGNILGFVLGSAHPARLRREVLRLNPFGIFFGVARGLLRRPASLRWLARTLRGPDEGAYDAEAPELTYLAVTEGRRGCGAGRRLVEAFTSAMRAAGQAACELSVDEDNLAAAAFYEKLSFVLIGRYREFGVLHRRCRLTWRPPEDAAEAPGFHGGRS